MKSLTFLSLMAFATTGVVGNVNADPVTPDTGSEQQLGHKVDTLSQQLDQLKTQLQDLKSANEALAMQQEQTQSGAQTATENQSSFNNVSLWGYGEIYYFRPTKRPEMTQADLARAVFGIGYRFDDSTHFNSEYEIEHAVVSADDPGEIEVEQFYVSHRFNNTLSGEAGLFLLPAGILNEHHEPTAFYGVQRNFVETLIIPSTWREGGIALRGDTDGGLSWNVGITTGVNMANWDFNPSEPLYENARELDEAGPLQQTHQELAQANAEHLSQYVSLNYNGIPGLETGAFIFTGLAAVPQGQPDQRVTLWETHARWRSGRSDLTALYARGSISNTASYNQLNPGGSNLMPAEFYGYYLQGAYTVWQSGRSKLAPFLRAERYDLGARYEGVPSGFSPVPTGSTATGGSWPIPNDRVWTVGANYYLNSHVVFKADFQHFAENDNFKRFDLGLGVDF